MREREYILFCDESDKKGAFFSNFYGGVLVGASQYRRITDKLEELKRSLNLKGEIKWSKVTDQYLLKYQEMMDCFFEEVAAGNLKVRVMFTQNALIPVGLSKEDLELQYFKLYYQFIKHAFGLRYVQSTPGGTRVRLYFDQFPDTGEKAEQFKGFLLGLTHSAEFRAAGIVLEKDAITEVRSHEHVLLQCLDVALGAMAFRLNDKHRVKPPGERVRGRRTRAKEALYRFILAELRKIRPNFNIGETTGADADTTNRWKQPYRHWKFKPSDAVYDASRTKRK